MSLLSEESAAQELERKRQDLAVLIDRLAVDDGDHETAIAGLNLYRSSQPINSKCGLYTSTLTLVAQGSKRVLLGGERYDYDQANYLVTTIDLPVIYSVTEASPERPCLCVVWQLDPSRIAELLTADLPPVKVSAGRGMSISPLSHDMLDAVLRLVRLLETPADIPMLAPLIERELLYRLIISDQGACLRQIAMTGSQTQQIARAIDWLRQHFSAPLRIQELARTVNMSVSSLHHHFKAITAMSPLQYQKLLRLQEARRLLLTEQCDAASAAHRVGYESPSQFSREYSRFYGAPPLRDVAQIRELASA
ncbi:AraC family transcriptional regulator [Dyella sp. GSA-30]|uniref:AraC family transcriptional regulator n=1 Tax=Dyella sp. GSA-30 TaxID=2994496 RepID=UPI002491DB5F|nr:AraC family transcriptional regulator [Dyella sp. GSA-30]BDU18741.1 AraC family transcriptional regulator [Dyella sp. GSA-30]